MVKVEAKSNDVVYLRTPLKLGVSLWWLASWDVLPYSNNSGKIREQNLNTQTDSAESGESLARLQCKMHCTV
jgi:hypothetical protein